MAHTEAGRPCLGQGRLMMARPDRYGAALAVGSGPGDALGTPG